MSPDLIKALLVLTVGMLTVFTILGLVILSGEALIMIINRFFPAAPDSSSGLSAPSETSPTDHQPGRASASKPEHVAAIIAFVNHLTEGKGIIKSIERINDGSN